MKITLKDPIIQNLVIRGIERRLGELSREREMLIDLWKKYNKELDIKIPVIKKKKIVKKRKWTDTQRIDHGIRMKEYWAKRKAKSA